MTRVPQTPPSPRRPRTGVVAAMLAAAAAACLSSACAPVLPPQPTQRALVRDTARVVDVRAKVGWFVDETEVEGALPDAMKSACRVNDKDRSAALQWLDQEIARQGGPVEEAWNRNGRKLDDLDTLLLLTRTRLLLGRADGWVRSGKCPFWIERQDSFAGIHVSVRRFILALEGGGRFIEEFGSGRVRYGGGGSGRLLAGFGLTETVNAFIGVEAGAGVRFVNPRLGTQTEIPTLVGVVALPLVLRYQLGLSTHLEGELGPMAYVNSLEQSSNGRQLEGQYDLGLRLGLGIGASYLRLQRGVMPFFTFSVSLDYVPEQEQRPQVIQISIGGRTGIHFSFL